MLPPKHSAYNFIDSSHQPYFPTVVENTEVQRDEVSHLGHIRVRQLGWDLPCGPKHTLLYDPKPRSHPAMLTQLTSELLQAS